MDHFVKLERLPEDLKLPPQFQNRLEFDSQSPEAHFSRLHEQVRVRPDQLADERLAVPPNSGRPLPPVHSRQ